MRAVTDELEVGLVVFNATGSFVGEFLDEGHDDARTQVAINVTAPLAVCDHFGRAMVERGRGGIVLMGSGAGVAGTAGLAVYSATKSFQLTLAQALWDDAELATFATLLGKFATALERDLETTRRQRGVDVLGVVGPAIDTPNFRRSFDHDPDQLPQKPMAPEQVAVDVLDALGEEMEIMPGAGNREGYAFLSALPRVEQARMLSANFAAAAGRSA